jgi:hypothetical protein
VYNLWITGITIEKGSKTITNTKRRGGLNMVCLVNNYKKLDIKD